MSHADVVGVDDYELGVAGVTQFFGQGLAFASVLSVSVG
jgi:hypothetical protein